MSIHQKIRQVLCYGLAAFLGILATEGFLRLITPPPIFYSSWFTKGVHQPDPEFGFSYAADYSGEMRHADGVWCEPLQLDHQGFRMPSTAAKEIGPRIVLLGGASMVFGYGLGEDEAIQGQIASSINRGQVQTLAWPGFTVVQDAKKYQHRLRTKPDDIVILFGYAPDDYRLTSDAMFADLIKRQHANDDIERYVTEIDSVRIPIEPAAQGVGKVFYRSYFLAGTLRLAQQLGLIVERITNRFSPRDDATNVPEESKPRRIDKDAKPLIFHVAKHLTMSTEAKVLIVALPKKDSIVGPPELPKSKFPMMDLRYLFSGDEHSADWIANGHYGNAASTAIGKTIAAKITREFGS